MKQTEVWLVDFSPKIGQEIDKRRPAIIVNHNSMGVLHLKVVVPVTDPLRSIKEWHVPCILQRGTVFQKKVSRIVFGLSPSLKKGL